MHEFKAEGRGSLNALQSVAKRASLAILLMCAAAISAEAGRIDGSQFGTTAPIPTLKCPPKIVPKCKPGEKPYCAEFSGKCCRAVSCRKTK
jgi:hypothetical protein